jgi:hypothetical protein
MTNRFLKRCVFSVCDVGKKQCVVVCIFHILPCRGSSLYNDVRGAVRQALPFEMYEGVSKSFRTESITK